MSIGEPDFDTPKHITDACIDALKRGETHYAPSNGIPELLGAISEKINRENGFTCTSQQVIVACGAKDAIYEATEAVLNPGDETILLTGVQDRLRCLVDRILGPAGDDHLLGGTGEPVLAVDLLADRTEQFGDTIARGIMGLPPLQGIDTRVGDVLWGIEIGFADRHTDDVDAFPLHLLGLIGDGDRG